MGRVCSMHGNKKYVKKLVGNPEEKRPLVRPRHRWNNDI
jgi:hypothetical protein